MRAVNEILGQRSPTATTHPAGPAGRGEQGLVSGLLNTARQLGGALGLTVLATAAASRMADRAAGGAAPADALSAGYGLAFLICAGFLAVGTCLVALLPKRAPRPAS
ncbi:hypothetical protein SCOCK_180067 [Actinacidiphila cocklensis]|jgi:hypothetical protein|uniref:Uncharacterized protein n=1 Tax=Actinacidiphila cocklensis TaxID=887465 RepID=A0A9W4E3N5_9ACTN|nr:hypothetical protein SCOCK_180067 [Actinacidiphila cocklensis]